VGSTTDDPALSEDGTIHVGSTGGRIVALSDEGNPKWEFNISGNIRSPSIDKSGNLYCGASTLVL